MTEELEKILRRDKSPLAENPYAKNENQMTPLERMAALAPPLEAEMQKHLTNFSLITHGFGGPAMVAVLNAFKHYLNSMKSNYEKISQTGLDLNNLNNPQAQTKLLNNNNFNSNSNARSLSNQQQHQQQSSSSSSSSPSGVNSYFSTSSSSNNNKNLSPIELSSLKVESKD